MVKAWIKMHFMVFWRWRSVRIVTSKTNNTEFRHLFEWCIYLVQMETNNTEGFWAIITFLDKHQASGRATILMSILSVCNCALYRWDLKVLCVFWMMVLPKNVVCVLVVNSPENCIFGSDLGEGLTYFHLIVAMETRCRHSRSQES